VFQLFKFRMVQTAVPLVLRVADLEAEAERAALLAELGRDAAFRVELPCGDGTRAFHKLEAVLKARRVPLTVDAAAAARLKKPEQKTSYALLLEDVTPDELLALLRALGAEDRQGKANEAQFGHVVVSRLGRDDRKELAELLGVEPARTQPPAADPKKPLADGTAGEVLKALDNPRAKPAGEALALTLNAARPQKPAPEVKRFLDGRKPARPGAVQVLLVLRAAGA
jgi:hypothetical protein